LICTCTGAEACNKWPQLLLNWQERVTAVLAAAGPCCRWLSVT
jgi:hypothetical protein